MSALTMKIQTHLYSKRTQSEFDSQSVGADALIRPSKTNGDTQSPQGALARCARATLQICVNETVMHNPVGVGVLDDPSTVGFCTNPRR